MKNLTARIVETLSPWRVFAFVSTALFLIWIYPFLGFDTALTAMYYDTAAQQFPNQHHWLFEHVLHNQLRTVLWLFPLTTLIILVRHLLTQGWSVQSQRWLWLLMAQIIAPLTVSLLKHTTNPICPWYLQEYGGALIEPLFSFVPWSQAGQCFPAGHPSAGLGLLAYVYFWRDGHPTRARAALGLALLLGALMGWAQIVRGAHFLSHVLWSLWVIALVFEILYVWAWP